MEVYLPLDEMPLLESTPEDQKMIEETTGCELICKNGIWYALQPGHQEDT